MPLAHRCEKTPMFEGVELTLKSLLTALEKFGVVAVDTANGFNADLHQAVGIDPNAKANEIGNGITKRLHLKWSFAPSSNGHGWRISLINSRVVKIFHPD